MHKNIKHLAATVVERIEALARFSEESDALTRPFGTPSWDAAREQISQWMQMAGFKPDEDLVGNVTATFCAPNPEAQTLLLGSHYDTVRDAGKYDGLLGVIIGLATLEFFKSNSVKLPFNLALSAFADEEGMRFHTAFLGSAHYTGSFPVSWLRKKDIRGITLGSILDERRESVRKRILNKKPPQDLLAYLEVHIEQDTWLEKAECPVGVVSTIAGQERIFLRFSGEGAHAGTSSMERRKDALAGGAEFILAVERYALENAPARATVCEVQNYPNVSNVVSSETALTLDLRHHDSLLLEQMHLKLREVAKAIAGKKCLQLDWRPVQSNHVIHCDPEWTKSLAKAAASFQATVPELVSWAGHDAVMFHPVCPIALLFVRCMDGISHHPHEYVSPEDIQIALSTLIRAIERQSKVFANG